MSKDQKQSLDEKECRRQSERKPQEESIIVQVVPHSKVVPIKNKPIYGETLDISERGVKVCLDHPLPPNSSIALWVDLETIHKRILLVGEVIWCKPESGSHNFTVGIQLSPENSEEADDWYELLNKEKMAFDKTCHI